MNVNELIEKLKKLPASVRESEVRYAVPKGNKKRTLYAISDTEIYGDWVLLKFSDR